MKKDEIDWNKCAEIANKTSNDDEYSGMTWGSPEEIDYICECLWVLKAEQDNITEIYGISLSRFRELIDLFVEQGYDIKDDSEWKELKRQFFKKWSDEE